MRCLTCGAENPPGRRFCSSCGSALTPTAPRQPAGGAAASPVPAVSQEPGGLAAAAVVFFVCAAVSWIGWLPLGLPALLVGAIVPPGDCTGVYPGTPEMYVCSAGVALLSAVGPLAVLLLLFLLRAPLAKLVRDLTLKVPEKARYLVTPVTATVLFTIAWSGLHSTEGGSGLLPQTMFPAVVGLFTFVTTRYGPALQRSLGPFFDFRDQFPKGLRLLVAVAVPLLLGLLITSEERVSAATFKEQIIALASMIAGYLAIAPGQGEPQSGVRRPAGGGRQDMGAEERRPGELTGPGRRR